MKAAVIFQESETIDEKLAGFDITQKELIDVALEAIAHRNHATPLHPLNAPGMFSYMWGTKALRQILLPKGWEIDRTNGVEAVSNSRLNKSIIFQNVDYACGGSDPVALSAKGDGSKSLVANNPYMFEYMQQEDDLNANKSVWFFCVSSEGEGLRAELSLPKSIDKGQFSSFIERIFILSENDNVMDRVDQHDALNTDIPKDVDIQITRKKL